MATRWACVGLSLVFLLGGAGEATAAISAVAISGGSTLSDGDTNGWRFQALADISVVSLGTWDENGDGLPALVDVGLWTDSGTLLGSLTLPSGTSATLIDGFRYADLLATIDLISGAFYRVGSSPQNGSLQYREGVSVSAAAEIAYDDGYYRPGGFGFPDTPGSFPDFNDFFGANFQYVPEPSTLAISSLLGLCGFGLYRRRKA